MEAAISLLRDVGGWVLRALGILRRSGLTLLFTSFAAALLCALGPLGPLGAVFFLGVGTSAAMNARDHDPKRFLLIGALVLSVAAPGAGAVLAGAHLAREHGAPHFLSGWALFFGMTFLGTFVLLPLLEAAARMARSGDGVSASIAASLVAAGRRGLVRTALAAAAATCVVVIVPLLDALGPVRIIHTPLASSELPTVLLLASAGGAVTWLGLMALGASLATEAPEHRARSRSAFAFVVTGIALLAGGALVGVALIPAPPAPIDPVLLGGAIDADPAITARIERPIPGSTLLVVRHHGYPTVTLPVADETPTPRLVRMPDGASAVILGAPGEDLAAIVIDEGGERLGDGPIDRVIAHVGLGAALALALSMALVALAVARARGRHRLHRAVRRGAESVVRGRLRAEAGGISVAAGHTRVAGATLEASDGSRVFSLPAGLAVLGADLPATIADGEILELVSADPAPTLSFRAGITPSPPDAALVMPGRERIDWLVGCWALAPSGQLLAAASLAAIAGTMLTLGGEAWLAELLPGTAAPSMVAALSPGPSADANEVNAARILRIVEHVPDGSMYVEPGATVITEARRSALLAAFATEDVHLSRTMVMSGIAPGSSLDLLGVENGDVLTHVAGARVSHPEDLRGLLAALGSLSAVGATVIRRGVEVELVVEIR